VTEHKIFVRICLLSSLSLVLATFSAGRFHTSGLNQLARLKRIVVDRNSFDLADLYPSTGECLDRHVPENSLGATSWYAPSYWLTHRLVSALDPHPADGHGPWYRFSLAGTTALFVVLIVALWIRILEASPIPHSLQILIALGMLAAPGVRDIAWGSPGNTMIVALGIATLLGMALRTSGENADLAPFLILTAAGLGLDHGLFTVALVLGARHRFTLSRPSSLLGLTAFACTMMLPLMMLRQQQTGSWWPAGVTSLTVEGSGFILTAMASSPLSWLGFVGLLLACQEDRRAGGWLAVGLALCFFHGPAAVHGGSLTTPDLSALALLAPGWILGLERLARRMVQRNLRFTFGALLSLSILVDSGGLTMVSESIKQWRNEQDQASLMPHHVGPLRQPFLLWGLRQAAAGDRSRLLFATSLSLVLILGLCHWILASRPSNRFILILILLPQVFLFGLISCLTEVRTRDSPLWEGSPRVVDLTHNQTSWYPSPPGRADYLDLVCRVTTEFATGYLDQIGRLKITFLDGSSRVKTLRIGADLVDRHTIGLGGSSGLPHGHFEAAWYELSTEATDSGELAPTLHAEPTIRLRWRLDCASPVREIHLEVDGSRARLDVQCMVLGQSIRSKEEPESWEEQSP